MMGRASQRRTTNESSWPIERAHQSEGQPGSVGLGLTVSRTLAELMGGSLTYRFDGRSVFRLELPSVADDEENVPSDQQLKGMEQERAMPTIGAGRIGVDVGLQVNT